MSGLESYTPELLVVVGLAFLALEVLVLGFTTFILFFLGLSLIITGGLAWAGLLPVSWPAILMANALLTAVLAGVLWRPLLKMQSQSDDKRVKSDFEGHRFFCPDAVDRQGLVNYAYSGIQWKLKSEEPLEADQEVEVIKAEVGVLWIRPTE